MKRADSAAAFEIYCSMGHERSYQAVADKLGIQKGTVVDIAKRDNWVERMKDIEEAARVKFDKRMVETTQQRAERHLKIVKAIQTKALEALRDLPLRKAMDAIKALDLAIKQERLILGDSTVNVNLQDTLRGAYEGLLIAHPTLANAEQDADRGGVDDEAGLN